MKKTLALVIFLVGFANLFAASGSVSGSDWTATYTTSEGGGSFSVNFSGVWTRPDNTANFYVQSFISKGSAGTAGSTVSWSYTLSGTTGTPANMRFFTLSADTGSTYYKYDVTMQFDGSGLYTPPPASTSSNKGIAMTYTNPSSTEGIWVGVARESAIGIVFDVQYVEAGGTYSKTISVPSTETANFKTVVIDADAAFAAGGGSVNYWEGANGGSNVYDFTGYTTGVGSAKNYTVNGVSIGQTSAPGADVPSVASTAGSSVVGTTASFRNPYYRSTGGAAPPTVTSSSAGSSPTQATDANNTNAITSALSDLRAAVQSSAGGGSTTVDMTGVIAAVNTVNSTLVAANSKQDANNTTATAIKDAVLASTTASNGRLDSLISSVNAAKTATETAASNTALNTGQLVSIGSGIGTTNGKLDSLVTGQTATNAKLDALVTAAGSGDGAKLDAIKTSVDAVGTKIDTSNNHLDVVEKIVTGTHPSQTGYDNASKVTQAQAAANSVAAYSGVKPTVGGALSVSIPGSGNWGNITVAGTNLIFGVGGMRSDLDALMVAGRSLILVALCLGFCKTSSGLVTKYTIALPQVVAQDTGFGPENVVPGGSQAKTYATAAVAVGVIFTGAAAIVALVDTFVTYYGGGIASIFSGISMPAASMAGQLDRYVPLAAALGLTVMSVALPYVVSPMYLATAAVLRFIKT